MLHPVVYDDENPRPAITYHPNREAQLAGQPEFKVQPIVQAARLRACAHCRCAQALAEPCYSWVNMYTDSARSVVKYE